MRLRDHPILKVTEDVNWWPPIWTNERKKLIGEFGTLVSSELWETLPTFIFIWIRYEGELFLGGLHVSDQPLCRQLHGLIAQHVGQTIEQIGDLEVGFLL